MLYKQQRLIFYMYCFCVTEIRKSIQNISSAAFMRPEVNLSIWMTRTNCDSYLGIILNNSGKYIEAKSKLYDKALKASFKLCRVIRSTSPPLKTLLHIFNHKIKPCMVVKNITRRKQWIYFKFTTVETMKNYVIHFRDVLSKQQISL